MLSPSALHKYVLIFAVIIGAAGVVMVIEMHERSPYWEVAWLIGEGVLLGQLWRWEPPR